ncbi:hypothetical protein ACOSP7_005168 [Xanthoceras sorbifolium]
MAANLRPLTFSIAGLLLFSCCLIFFDNVKLATCLDGSLERYSLGSVDYSGPSPSGPGHKPRYAQVQDSGPRSGAGHHHVNFNRMTRQ